jgi:hypothetical protein
MQGSATCLSDIGKTQALGSERTEGIFYMGFLFFFSLLFFGFLFSFLPFPFPFSLFLPSFAFISLIFFFLSLFLSTWSYYVV